MPDTTLHRDVERRLADEDVRYTRGRRIVVAALAEADGPRSAAELNDAIGANVPLSSLYRTLSVLEQSDVVSPHFVADGIARYELAEWLLGHHHHLVCTMCGAVEDVEVPFEHERRVRDLIDEIASATEFSPSNHALEIEGVCKACAR